MHGVHETKDREALHRRLVEDRLAAAYLLGDLDPRYFDYCRFWVCTQDPGDAAPDGGAGSVTATPCNGAVLMLYSGLRMPAVLTVGDPAGIEKILDEPAVRRELPGRFYVHISGLHLAAFQSYFRVDDLRHMVRMGLARNDFVCPGDDLPDVTPVTHADTAELMSLYQFYPDSFFEPYQLETGYYYGVRVEGRLVSVAGIHVFSETYDVACLGNVVTHPDHRRRGHSRRCTSRLLQALFEKVTLVALNVRRENLAARAVYAALGFMDHMKYLEGMVATRKGR